MQLRRIRIKEAYVRDWLKTGTYGIMHLLVAMAVAFAISGSWRVALGIGIVEPLVQTLFYSLHERLWGRMKRRSAPARGLPPVRLVPRQNPPGRSPHPCVNCP